MTSGLSSVQGLFNQAVGLYNQGHLDQAGHLCRQILALQPRHADSLHFLGMISMATNRHEQAVKWLKQAVAINPNDAAYQSNLGTALQNLGQWKDAVACHRKAIAIMPQQYVCHYNLGNALQELGQLDQAAACFRKVIALKPDHAKSYNNLGIVLAAQGRLDEAVGCYDRAIGLQPDYVQAHSNLGNAYQELGRLDLALASYREAINLTPDFAEAHSNLGNVLQKLGQTEQAVASYAKAIALCPDYAQAHNNLGNAYQDQGRIEDAITCYGMAIALNPNYAEAFGNLGNAYHLQGRTDDALAAYRRAIALNSGFAQAHNNLGNAYRDLGQFEDSLAAYRRAIKLNPGFAEAHSNLGYMFQLLGKLDLAVVSCAQALALKPDFTQALDRLVHQRRHLCDWQGLQDLENRLLELGRQNWKDVSPFSLLALSSTLSDQLDCARQFGAQYKMDQAPLVSSSLLQQSAKIRIGYLSADFHEHATAYLIAELIERHDRNRFQIIGYSIGPADASPMRQRLVDSLDQFVDLRAVSHRQAAQAIQNDGIDILVDLKGFTKDCRPGILAYRPAPLQVNFLGYPGTMGSDFIDYIIADPICIPSDHDRFYREKVVRLPDCYQPNDTKRAIAPLTPTRAECGLPEQGFVFCSFNNSYKITSAIFDIWMRLLARVPDSVLWLLEANSWVKTNLRQQAALRGINPDRLVFAPRRPLGEHLARQRLADLFLDSYPYNAHTTASDALWVGLPVVTCIGPTFAGRVAASLLTNMGLPELIAHSFEEYESLAIKLATDQEALASIRLKASENPSKTPLFDIERYTRNIENAYSRMWQIWSETGRMESFDLSPP